MSSSESPPRSETDGSQADTPRAVSSQSRYLIILALIGLLPALVIPVRRYGDASDYVMMTMSLAHDGDLAYEDKDIDRVEHARPEGTDYPAGLFLIRAAEGRLFIGGHSFYYSLLAAPFYLCFGFSGFLVLNGLLWVTVVGLVRHHWRGSLGTRSSWLLAIAALWPCAAYDYIIWQTPATWLLFISAAFLASYANRRFTLAGLCLGLAAASQYALFLWVAIPIIDFLRKRLTVSEMGMLGMAAAVGVVPQILYFTRVAGLLHVTWLGLNTPARYLYFVDGFPGQESFDRPIHAVAFSRFSRPEHLDPTALASALFSPSMGLLWFYPFSILAVVRMVREKRGATYMAAAFLVLAAFATAAELETHQVGLRYLNPLYPAFLFGFRSFSRRRFDILALVLAVALGLSFAGFPRANSSVRIWDKAVPTARFYKP